MSETIRIHEEILAPKIKHRKFRRKVILDPADFRKGLPQIRFPELCENGIILSAKSEKCGVARLTCDASLKLNVIYNAQVLYLVGRYAEVQIIDDCCDDFWIGMLFGFIVKGTGGEGKRRDCKILKIMRNSYLIGEGNNTVVKGKQIWQRIAKKVTTIISQQSG